jgi:voltage-gated potassium channel
MPIPRIEQLELARPRGSNRRGSRLWREWCFIRVVFRHFGVRFGIMAALLLGGAVLFKALEPEKKHSFPQAMYNTWSLVFAEPPEAFPRSTVLRIMFFIVPILGLTVIIEAIIDFALMLRERRRFERSWCIMLAKSFSNHIVLVGFGRLGYRIFTLLRKLGEAVVVIERDPNGQFLAELRRDGSPLLIGDARRDQLLVEANIAQARSVICATDDDMANLEIALDARRIVPKIRVVLRLFDQNLADKLSEGLNIHLAMSQSALSAPTFAISAIAPAIVDSFMLGSQLVVMQRWLVRQDGPLYERTVGEVTSELGVGVVEHTPAGSRPALLPPPSTRLEAGDGVVLQGPLDVLSRLWEQNTAAVSTAAAP